MASKILITMDDLESAVRLNAALEAAQHRTVMISPMDDARGALRKEHPDLLVLTGAVHESQAQQLVAQARDEEVSSLALLEPTDPAQTDREELGVDVTEVSVKPINPPDTVALIERLVDRRQLQQRTGISGESAAIQELLVRIEQMAPVSSTVLIQGESGTGKELVAKAIHDLSPRRGKPFIPVNCAALPESLLESELFGFERGAFTGAQQPKPGQIELAAGGVLFLDEVTEMTPAAQAKFLRVLQEREFVRLGGTRPVRANVRVIAATNRDLREAVAHGHFRADLYYRLNVFDIQIPPLRERREDIPILVASFLNECAHMAGHPVTLAAAAMEALRQHDWPGNVRELRNVIERASIVCTKGVIRADDLSLWPAAGKELDSTDLEVIERRTIERVLRETNGNKLQASRKLGISRTQLYVRLRKYGLDHPAEPTVGEPEMADAVAGALR